MGNHLIIGIGGTGGRIIRAFRKRVFREFRGLNPGNVNIEYLYLDSYPDMMGLDDPSWRVLGHSLQLERHQQLLIGGSQSGLSGVLENLDHYPGIGRWVGNKEQWQDILNGFAGEITGGQKRRLGRFLFALRVNEFRQQVSHQIRVLQQRGNVVTTFHVCCGLAGGTGSGCVIDVISQSREMYPDRRNYRILLYALLPERHPKHNLDKGNYQANGYAALTELNALSVEAWGPHDLTGKQERLSLHAPFTGCYIFCNEDEKGFLVDVMEELPDQIAGFLYQKIVAVDECNWPGLARIEFFEGVNGVPEFNPNSGEAKRSKQFLTFGMKSLVYPEHEIREYMTYSFARQSTLQMLYNNWSDAQGFLDELRGKTYTEFDRIEEVRGRWKMTDEHLCLSTGILPEEIADREWRPIEIYWSEFISILKEDVKRHEWKSWLDRMLAQCEEMFDSNYRYRGLGVCEFYEMKYARRKEHAKEIRKCIETDLFSEWERGAFSVDDAARFLDELLDELSQIRAKMDEMAHRTRQKVEVALRMLDEIRRAWAKMFCIAALFGKRDRLQDAYSYCLRKYYTNRTYLEGYRFAETLLREIISEVTSLREEVRGCERFLSQAARQFRDEIDSRCIDGGAADLRGPVVKFYNALEVKGFTKRLTTDRQVQHSQASDVRMAIVARLGEDPSFGDLNRWMDRYEFNPILESTSEDGALRAHEDLVARDPHIPRQLGVGIIEKLYETYGHSQEGLRIYINELVGHTATYLTFNPSEVNRMGPGIPTSDSKIPSFTVILPQTPHRAEFLATLAEIFRHSRSPVEVVHSEHSQTEISLVPITHCFPLRFVSQVRFLHDRYQDRINGPGSERAKLELHSEGDGTQYPNLFTVSARSIAGFADPRTETRQVDRDQIPLRREAGETPFPLPQDDGKGVEKLALEPPSPGQPLSDSGACEADTTATSDSDTAPFPPSPPSVKVNDDTHPLTPTLLGVAIDVSGSMKTSISNDAAMNLTRLDGVGRGFDTLLAESQRIARQHSAGSHLPLRIFAYAFGLTIEPGYADLLSIIKFAGDINGNADFNAFLEESKRRRREQAEQKGEQMRKRASQYGQLEDLARSHGLGSVLDGYKRRAEEKARRRLTQEAEEGVRQDVLLYLRERIADTTMDAAELAAVWGQSGDGFKEARQFIFGMTPMRSCLNEIVGRFKREADKATSPEGERVLLLISDGEPTDGDPTEFAVAMREQGIHIACAFVTNQDVHAPRKLLSKADPSWPEGAKLLFEMASSLDEAGHGVTGDGREWRRILQQSGWETPDDAHLFVQVNHSEVLADFMRIAATAMPAKKLFQSISFTS